MKLERPTTVAAAAEALRSEPDADSAEAKLLRELGFVRDALAREVEEVLQRLSRPR